MSPQLRLGATKGGSTSSSIKAGCFSSQCCDAVVSASCLLQTAVGVRALGSPVDLEVNASLQLIAQVRPVCCEKAVTAFLSTATWLEWSRRKLGASRPTQPHIAQALCCHNAGRSTQLADKLRPGGPNLSLCTDALLISELRCARKGSKIDNWQQQHRMCSANKQGLCGGGCNSPHLVCEEAHGEGRGIDNAHSLALQVGHQVSECLVIQRVVAVGQHCVDSPSRHSVEHICFCQRCLCQRCLCSLSLPWYCLRRGLLRVRLERNWHRLTHALANKELPRNDRVDASLAACAGRHVRSLHNCAANSERDLCCCHET